ncbi:MAG: hypothetical protein ACR2ID_05360 [Chthoniobacterales bacterium]
MVAFVAFADVVLTAALGAAAALAADVFFTDAALASFTGVVAFATLAGVALNAVLGAATALAAGAFFTSAALAAGAFFGVAFFAVTFFEVAFFAAVVEAFLLFVLAIKNEYSALSPGAERTLN